MPIARVYETEQQAQDAAARLGSELPGSTITVVTPADGGNAAATLEKGGVDAGDAAAYAAEVGNGRSVVATSAPYGQGILVKSVLDEFGPLTMGPLPSERTQASSRHTPFSEALGWSLLTNKTQQAWFWGAELKRHDVTSLGQPRLKPYTVASLGFPLIQRKYNWSFGIPRLQRKYNWSFGIPRLLRSYNLSFGIPRLMRR